MSRALALLLPGDPDTPTGGYLYDRRMAEGLRALGWLVDVLRLDDSFPAPTPPALEHAARTLAALRDDTLVLADGLALGAMPRIAAAESRRLRIVALVHHPLALETGLAPARARELRDSERAALAAVRAVVVTSEETASELQRDYGVEAARLAVVEPGAPASAAARTGVRAPGAPLRLLCVASLAPRKGHDLLLRALAALPAPRDPAGAPLDWTLECIGSATREPAHARALAALAQSNGLGARVAWRGELPAAQVAAAYAAADVFVLPAWYEGYGMAVAEAIAHGLPVVATAVGAAPRVVGTEAGLLVEPGDLDALTVALTRVLGDAALRARLAAGAAARAAQLPQWPSQAARLAAALERFGRLAPRVAPAAFPAGVHG